MREVMGSIPVFSSWFIIWQITASSSRLAINCWVRVAKVPLMMFLKRFVRGNIPLNISLVMLIDLRGISSDGRVRSLCMREMAGPVPVFFRE